MSSEMLLQLEDEESTVGAAVSRRRKHRLTLFVVRRLAQGVLTLLAVSVVIFVAMTVLPGSPASAILGPHANAAAIAAIDRKIGYDRPVVIRYFLWLGGLLHGNFGNSAVGVAQGAKSDPIWPIIRGPLANTGTLGSITFVILVPLSLVLGMVAAKKHGRALDHIISTGTLVLMALPEFVVGALLIAVFFVALGLLPPVSLLAPGQIAFAHPKILILPVCTLLAVSVAWTVRLVRVGAIEVLRADYVQMARLAGMKEGRVTYRYVLRNALAPGIQIFALSAQYLLGGVIVTETVFNYPGMGVQLVQAVNAHDNTQVQALAMIIAAIYIATNIVADFLLIVIVPKLRTQT